MKLSAFILAAGLGDRLQPITKCLPKPLIPILGKPVLQTVIEKVSFVTDRIGVNLHYKRDFIEDWIIRSGFVDMIKLFPEDPALGTGGALRNAEAFLEDGSFLVHNSDIISDMDLMELIGCHLSSGNLATLAVHNRPEFNKLVINEQGDLKAPDGNPADTDRLLAFTGVAVYRPEFLQLLPPGISSVVHAWFKAIASGHRIGTLDVSGCYWTDIGTPASYAKAVIRELNRDGETVYIHPAITWCNNATLDGHVVIEKDSSCDRVSLLKNCIILPGTDITMNG